MTFQSMKGFDPEFTDIIDYIVRITDRIWKDKQIHLCRDYYSSDCPVYTLAGMSVGAEEVTGNTENTLVAFPDRILLAEAVICGGNDNDGYHTSHLIHTTMTSHGDSEFGPASGKSAAIKVIAHCIVKDNRIIEEWLVRDNFLLAEQLGFDPQVVAKRWAATAQQERFVRWRDNEINRIRRHPRLEDSFIARMLNSIWNSKKTEVITQAYSTHARLHASANRELIGHDEIEGFYAQFQSTFSDLVFSVDYVCQQGFRITDGGHCAGSSRSRAMGR